MIFATFVDNPMDIEKFLKGLLFPNTLMWYLWVLAFYYVFFIKIIRMRSNIILAFLFITMLFVGRIGEELISLRLCVKNFLCCAGYFYIWIEKKRKIPQYFRLISVLIAGCFGFFYFAYNNAFSFMPLIVRIILESLNAAAVTILCFFVFMEYTDGSHLLDTYLCRNCYESCDYKNGIFKCFCCSYIYLDCGYGYSIYYLEG